MDETSSELGISIHETDLGRNLVDPPGAQRVRLSLVQQVHVSVYSSEQDLAIGMDRTRDMITKIAETVKDVTVATDNCQTKHHARAEHPGGRLLSSSSAFLASITTTTIAFDCSSGVAEPMRFSARSPSPSPVRRCVSLDPYSR